MIGGVPNQRDSAAPAQGPLCAFQAQMEALAKQVAAIDLRQFEMLSAELLWQELVPATTRLVREARSLVAEVIAACGPAADTGGLAGDAGLHAPFLSFERAIDAAVAVATDGASRRAVEDIAFLVQLELRQRDERLARITGASGALTLLGECDSALRRICKGAAAIDLAIARADQAAPRLDFSSELNDSLRVRRAYARFRARLLALTDAPATRELYPRMRAAGTHIAMLVGWDAYPLLRVRDRLQLRELQQRILEWLRPEHRGDQTAGMRLWQDVVGFVEMLTLVNRRQELFEHDGRVIVEALTSADAVDLQRLRSIEGLDDELDRLMGSTEAGPAEVRDTLERLAARLGVAKEPTA